MNPMLNIDVSKEASFDLDDLRFDEIIPMRIKQNQPIRESDVNVIQSKIIKECNELDKGFHLSQSMYYYFIEQACELERVRDKYRDSSEITNDYERSLFESGLDPVDEQNKAEFYKQHASDKYEQDLHDLFHRICETQYFNLDNVSVDVIGRRPDGKQKSWVFVTESTLKRLDNAYGNEWSKYSSQFWKNRIYGVCDDMIALNHERESDRVKRAEELIPDELPVSPNDRYFG